MTDNDKARYSSLMEKASEKKQRGRNLKRIREELHSQQFESMMVAQGGTGDTPASKISLASASTLSTASSRTS